MIKDIFIKKENQLMLLVVGISVLLVILGFYLLNKKGENGLEPRVIPNSEEEIVWKDFSSNKFNFSIQYPEHFKHLEDKVEFGPTFNFYFDKGQNNPPFDNFVNQSHVSVYPQGIVNQGPGHMEYFEQSDFTNKNGVVFTLREYKTPKGDVWAIMATPKEVPESWVDFGFLWISSEIKDMSTSCFDGKTEKNIDLCNPLEGDQFYLNGKVNSDFIKIGREMLDRFSFE